MPISGMEQYPHVKQKVSLILNWLKFEFLYKRQYGDSFTDKILYICANYHVS